jgi:catechol 2,3-dioxygenase-like lactoylglutathione lyase family enzyme
MGPLHHVGVIMRNERALNDHLSLMGLEEDYRGYVEAWDALCVFTKAAAGASPVEFVIAGGGSLKAFNRGLGGVHHLAYRVDDLDRAMRALDERGARCLQPFGIKGAGPFLCGFIDPIYTGNALIELVQEVAP